MRLKWIEGVRLSKVGTLQGTTIQRKGRKRRAFLEGKGKGRKGPLRLKEELMDSKPSEGSGSSSEIKEKAEFTQCGLIFKSRYFVEGKANSTTSGVIRTVRKKTGKFIKREEACRRRLSHRRRRGGPTMA